MEVRTLLNAVPQRLIDLRKRKSNQNDQQGGQPPRFRQSMPPRKPLSTIPMQRKASQLSCQGTKLRRVPGPATSRWTRCCASSGCYAS
jgi:hypothetical protein